MNRKMFVKIFTVLALLFICGHFEGRCSRCEKWTQEEAISSKNPHIDQLINEFKIIFVQILVFEFNVVEGLLDV